VQADSIPSNTNPGGWLECQDLDMVFYTNGGQFTYDSSLGQWATQMTEGLLKMGMDPFPCQKLEGWMRDAGFINIKYELFPIPVGPWPKDKVMVCGPSAKEFSANTSPEGNWHV
jgi:hypothetical protein